MYFTNNTTMPLNKVPPKNYEPQTAAPDVIQPGDSPNWSVPAGSQTEVAYQIGSLSNTVIVDVTCADNDPTGFGGIGQRLPNTYHAYINGGGPTGDGAYKIPPAQDWPNTDSGPNLGLTLSPTTYSDLNSAQQAAFSGVIAAAAVINAAPYEITSFIDLITQFNGNQITLPALIDELKKFTADPTKDTYSGLSSELQAMLTGVMNAADVIKAAPYEVDSFVDIITQFNGNQITVPALIDQLKAFTADPTKDTYSGLSSELQTTLTGVINAANAMQANPEQVASFIDLIKQFNGNQITVPELNDRLQKYSLSSQHCGDLDAVLQTTFQCVGYGAVLLETDTGKNTDFVGFIEDFVSPTSTTTLQQLNTKLISWLAYGPGLIANPNSSLKYSDLSEALQLTFGLLKNVAPPQVGSQSLNSQFSQIITNFQLGQFTVAELNTQLQSLIPS
jgi:Mor family transcriptional regulator